MKIMDNDEMRSINGGTTYGCPFGCNYVGQYWSVYAHCLKQKCFLNNFWLSSLYYGGTLGIKSGNLLKGITSFIKKNPTGKRWNGKWTW